MNIVQINGKTIKSSGNISVKDGKVFVGGDLIEIEEKEITIIIKGDNTEVSVDACDTIIVEGSDK